MSTSPSPQRSGASSSLVSIRKLKKHFLHMGRVLPVLRGIDLDIGTGEVVAIVGKSGAGKSTLLHIIGTLDLPTAGSIQLGRYQLKGLSGARLAAIRNEMIGFVFQFHHLLPEFNALENVMMPGMIQGRPRREMISRAKKLLAEVGLADRASHRPGELSGGEQQRVALARALVLEPKLILADEPTGNLDTQTSDAIHDLFFQVNREHGTTIVVVTHNITFAASMPRVVTMRDGLIANDQLSDGSPIDLFPSSRGRTSRVSAAGAAGTGPQSESSDDDQGAEAQSERGGADELPTSARP